MQVRLSIQSVICKKAYHTQRMLAFISGSYVYIHVVTDAIKYMLITVSTNSALAQTMHPPVYVCLAFIAPSPVGR